MAGIMASTRLTRAEVEGETLRVHVLCWECQYRRLHGVSSERRVLSHISGKVHNEVGEDGATSSQFFDWIHIDKGRDAMASATRRSRLLDTDARALRFGRCRVATLSRVFGEIHKQEGRRLPSMSDDWDARVLVGQGRGSMMFPSIVFTMFSESVARQHGPTYPYGCNLCVLGGPHRGRTGTKS